MSTSAAIARTLQETEARPELALVPSADPDPAGTGRDPEFIRRHMNVLETFASYFNPEVRGIDRLPDNGPFLIVGNHSGGAAPPDMPILMTEWWKQRGADEPVYGLFHSAFINIPGVGGAMKKAGGIEADPASAEKALRAGGSVFVFPGGDHEVFRPWTDRNKIDFAGRTGFIKLALRTGVPVVPAVSCGAHNSVVVLSRGDRLVRWMPHMRLMRVKVMPIMLGLPWGISFGLPTLPLPAKVTVDVGRPIDLAARYGADAAENEDTVRRIYEDVTGGMQATMDALVGERTAQPELAQD
jgi:1-acyl-sn-glycerol-3-phosphate acyltransferase